MFHKERLISNFFIAIESVALNKLRSLLTALGIIFGVAAVITMLAIGKGAEKEIMDQMELVGVNNILITSFVKQDQRDVNNEIKSEVDKTLESEHGFEISPGLSLNDADNIKARIPGVMEVSPEISIDASVIRKGIWRKTQLIGVTNDFFKVYNFNLSAGREFSGNQLSRGLPVCIIGEEIRQRFINEVNPIGAKIKLNNHWLTVVGVLESKNVTVKATEVKDLGIRDYNMDVYIPLKTMLLRYENRSMITTDFVLKSQKKSSIKNYHQLNKLVVKIEDGYNINDVSQLISKILKRKHQGVIDYKITIPELLLKQQQQAKKLFSIVLAVIAGISLLVGGIGIMNIMLASVLERIKEIGLRIALGAKQQDIVQQFLFEAVIISVSGGVVGVLLGAIFSVLISKFTGITTIISLLSVLISFIVAVTIGVIFGIAPAKKAAMQDPINSLRHE